MIRFVHVIVGVGRLLGAFSAMMLIPLLVALIMEPWDEPLFMGLSAPTNALVFLLSSFVGGSVALALVVWGRNHFEGHFHDREAYLSVGIGWLVLVLFSTLPFILSGTLPAFADAFFEAMSGLTASGGTVISYPLEDVAPSVMFWRAGMQYLGGMGIIVLSIALLARMTHGGSLLLAAEMSGAGMHRIRPRLRETARALWKIYGIFSLVCFAFYFLAMHFHSGLPWNHALYDAIIHTFTTMSTAGFSNHSASIAFYDSWIVELIVIVFVLIAGTNFALHDSWMRGNWKRLLRDPEWRFFIGMFVVATLIITLKLIWAGDTGAAALRAASFTVASIGTSLGYATVDYDQWSDAAKAILVVLMMTGASAGSTSGGLKALRVLLLFKVVRRQLTKILHPRAVVPVRLGGRIIPDDALMTVTAFLFTYVAVWFIGAAIIITTDPALDLFDGVAAAAASIGNTGPALGVVGPTDHFGILRPSTKFVLSLLMWIGRLEVFTALLLFMPSTWKRR